MAVGYLIGFLSLLAINRASSPVPVVLWHGMGDSSRGSTSHLVRIIEKKLPGVYIKSIQIGGSEVEDLARSFLGDVNLQVEGVCMELSSNPNLKRPFNLIGFSQGGQFTRALVQRCSGLQVKNLISMAGQHQGVFGMPRCTPEFFHFCEYLRELLSKAAYEEHMQRKSIQAQYWHDPLQEEVHRHKSRFIANINQEQGFNSTYRENMIRLENFVLVKSNNDTIVIPKETEWFGYYRPGQTTEFYKLEESEIFAKDLLGLRTLSEGGRLKFLSYDGDHLHFNSSWFTENIVERFLV